MFRWLSPWLVGEERERHQCGNFDCSAILVLRREKRNVKSIAISSLRLLSTRINQVWRQLFFRRKPTDTVNALKIVLCQRVVISHCANGFRVKFYKDVI